MADEIDILQDPTGQSNAALVAPAPPPVQSPVTSVVVPPMDPAQALRAQQMAQQQSMWQRLRQSTASAPIAQAEAAVAAALRFQGQRQYQQDLASGMAPGEALARNAPLIFGGQKQGTLGQAGTFVRATTPRMVDVGGVLYRQNQDGSVTPLTAPKAPPTPTLLQQQSIDLRRRAAISGIMNQIAKTTKELDALTTTEQQGKLPNAGFSPLANEKRQMLNDLRSQLNSFRQPTTGGTGTAAPAPAATPTRSTETSGRVRVRNSEGKVGTIPASQLDAAIAAGYSEVK